MNLCKSKVESWNHEEELLIGATETIFRVGLFLEWLFLEIDAFLFSKIKLQIIEKWVSKWSKSKLPKIWKKTQNPW